MSPRPERVLNVTPESQLLRPPMKTRGQNHQLAWPGVPGAQGACTGPASPAKPA